MEEADQLLREAINDVMQMIGDLPEQQQETDLASRKWTLAHRRIASRGGYLAHHWAISVSVDTSSTSPMLVE